MQTMDIHPAMRLTTVICAVLSMLSPVFGSTSRDLPNIVVIMTDDQRWDSLGCYGHKVVKTPHIDALAREGTLFNNAFTAAVLCGPSRTSFYTGRYATRNQSWDNGPASLIGIGRFSFFEPLKQAGYRLGLAGKNHLLQKEYAEEWLDFFEEYDAHGKESGRLTEADKALARWRKTSGPRSSMGNYLLEGLIDRPEPFPEEQCMEARIADDAIDFIRQSAGGPFFLHMAFPMPHWPNVVCEPYFSMYRDQLDRIELPGMGRIDWDTHPFAHYVQSQCAGFDTMSAEDRRKILAVMYGQITFVDKSVGRLVAALREAGVYDNTLIVFTSDQGSLGGQFGLPCKTKGFYEALIRIPLVVKMPGDKERARTADAQVSNIDIMPTLLERAGVRFSGTIDGRPFLHVLTGGRDSHRGVIYSEVGQPRLPPAPIPKADYPAYNRRRSAENMFWFIEYTTRGRAAMIREDGWKYCFYNGDMDELYHYEEDPLELVNLADAPEHRARLESMREKLFRKGFHGIR